MEANYRPVYIPPLNLTPKPESKAVLERILSSGCLDAQKQKSSASLLKNNSGFIKEKSLYRCFISKNKISQSQEKYASFDKKDQTDKQFNFPQPKLQRFFSKDQLIKKESCVQISTKASNDMRQKYFKRKTHINRTQAQAIKVKTGDYTPQIEAKQEQKNWLALLNSETDFNTPQQSQKEGRQMDTIENVEITLLRETNANILRENSQLKGKLTESQKKISQLQNTIDLIKKQKINLEERLRNAFSKICQYQMDYEGLTKQLQTKEKAIHELQSGYKYMQIQNIVLNHAKSQCSRQMMALEHLEKEKKVLQEKIRLFYINQKKSSKKPRLSECSQVSLTLSVQNEQINKIDELLSTERSNPQESSMRRSELSERIYTYSHPK